MKPRTTAAWLLVIGFSLAVGHLLWTRWLGPPASPRYTIGGEVLALVAHESKPTYFYLRKRLYLSQRPRHAWLEVLASDHARLIVNGKLVEQQAKEGLATGMVADITGLLGVGANVIAVVVERNTIDTAPAAAITGGYVLSDGEHVITSAGGWKYSTESERSASWWFAREFDDSSWRTPKIESRWLRAGVDRPPGAVRTPPFSPWISPPGTGNLSAALRRDFWLPAGPKAAWLRLRLGASYRLAINGRIVDSRETGLGIGQPPSPSQFTYEITSLLRPGRNTLALLLSSPTGHPRAQADLEIEDTAGKIHHVGTDAEWRAMFGKPPDWQSAGRDVASGWSPCIVESGDLGGAPWEMARVFTQVTLPLDEIARRIFWEALTVVLLGVATLMACRKAEQSLAARLPDRPAQVPLVFWALLPSSLVAVAVQLAIYDPRVMADQIHWRVLIVLLLAAVPMQWRVLAQRARSGASSINLPWRLANERMLITGLIAVILISGSYLRLRHIATEPLNPDEVSDYHATMQSLKTGIPGLFISKDLPFRPKTTSELTSIGTALTGLIFTDECWVMRFPSVCLAAGTILLLFQFGRRVFGPASGLIAAALYAFSPYCIQMANFGRYFSQLQFFVLLTVYFLWQTIRGSGPLDRRALWLTTAAFLAAYLSWEGVALFGPGMVIAAIIQRRGHLGTLFKDNAVYACAAVVLAVVIVQLGCRLMVQTQFLIYGTGTADVTLKPMWQYPSFSIWYYTAATTWTSEGIYSLLGFCGAVFLALRHGFRGPVRVLLLTWLGNAWVMSALLPVRAPRYSYHLVPLLLLLIGAGLTAVLRSLQRSVKGQSIPEWWQGYARWLGLGAVVALLVFVGGGVVRLVDFKPLRVAGIYFLDELKFPDMRESVAYLRSHYQEGDIVLASEPHVLNHYMKEAVTDYWPETRLHLQATLGDSRSQPLHRIGGAEMISSVEALQDLFARHRRIWYFATPGMNRKINEREASIYLRENMDVVRQDSLHVLLLRDGNRPVSGARAADRALQRSGASFLP